MRSLVVGSLLLIGCGTDYPDPIDVSAGRLTARIAPEPARISLLLDGEVVWQTREGEQTDGKAPPHGFGAIGGLAADIEMQFGSFRFTEHTDAEVWQPIERLTDVVASDTGATFGFEINGSPAGTGELVFVTATKSGPDPDAAGFPRHVRIHLVADSADRIQLGSEIKADEHLVGLGGHSFDIDHRGETVPLWVQEDGIGKQPTSDYDFNGLWQLTGRKHSTHTPMPMMLSSRGYALALDGDARAVFDLGSKPATAARFETWSNVLDAQIFIGDGPRDAAIAGDAARDAFGHMIAWVGKPDRPPVAVFAPWIDAILGSANVRSIAQQLRTNGIAGSAIWTEDWRGGVMGGTSGYALEEDWHLDRALYPDFEQLGDDLRGDGFQFLTYHNTFLEAAADVFAEADAGGYGIHKDGATYTFLDAGFSNTSMLDLSNPAAVTWAKGIMQEARTLGSDGWMADFAEWLPTDATLASGEPAITAHNRYPLEWARLNHELFAQPIANRPPPIYFMRSAWLHSQPLVQVMWPGDQQTDYTQGDGLPSVVPICVNLGLAGLPYVGSDIAGYTSLDGAVPTTDELFHRWVTLGAFSPVMRTHHGREIDKNVQWFTDAGTIAHFRRWTRFHMQLVPYQLGNIESFERDGLPLMRMVALDYPGEDWAWTTLDEYLLGDRILVAPIVAEGWISRVLELPAGDWVPLFGGETVSGTITATATKTEIPAFVPAGALLVLFPDGVDTVLDAPNLASAKTATEVADDREVWLYPGTAANPAHASWNDALGVTGPAHWTWSGRPAGPPPATAMFNGAPVTVTGGAVTVIGDGTLVIGGGTLTIARGKPAAAATIRLR